MRTLVETSPARLSFGDVAHGIEFTATCIGPISGMNWSLAPLYTQESVESNSDLARILARVLSGAGTRIAFAPSVASQSGSFVEPFELSTVLRLPYGIELRRKKELPSDATSIERGQAFIMSGGGCPVLVAIAKNTCIVAHASRESLLDRSRIMGGEHREYESVVHSIAAALKNRGASLPEAVLYSFFAVDPEAFIHHFDHPDGGYNLRMASYVVDRWRDAVTTFPDRALLDCAKLAELQALEAGFGSVQIAGTLSADGPFGHTRHTRKEMQTERNLVIVIRN